MGRIKINEIKYEGENYFYVNNRFKDGLNIVLGENGNGKSTFTYLIVYALGLNVPFFSIDSDEDSITQIINDINNYVEMNVTINNNSYILNRKIGSNYISVLDCADGQCVSLSLVRNGYLYEKEMRTFSDWMFEKLGINLIEINQNSTTHRVNFDDLMRLIYYDQITENRKIISEFGISTSNFYKNGSVMKKSIFEILISGFFEEYYNTYYEIKELNSTRQQYIEQKNAIDALIANIEANIGQVEDDKVYAQLEMHNKELDRLTDIRKSITSKGSFSDEIINRLTQMQREVVKLISQKNSIELYLEDIEEDLSKSLLVRENIKSDIKHLEKILFTSQYINVISEGKCPFCQETLKLEESKCICGSDKYLDYHKFIYSDKEYINIMKSKIKGLKTTNETIEYCEYEKENSKNELDKIDAVIQERMQQIKSITEGAGYTSNNDAVDEITDKIIKLKEKISDIQALEEKYNELTEVKKHIDSTDTKISKKKTRLEELEEEKEKEIEKNLTSFETQYEKFLIEFYGQDSIKEVSLNRNYMPIIGEYKEQSFNVPKRAFFYLSLLKLSLEEDKSINFPRFLIIDTMKAEGIDIEKLKLLIAFFDKYEDKDCQIIFTSGYEEHIKEMDKYVIERLCNDNKLLKSKKN